MMARFVPNYSANGGSRQGRVSFGVLGDPGVPWPPQQGSVADEQGGLVIFLYLGQGALGHPIECPDRKPCG